MAASSAGGSSRTVVLVHGAWHAGSCWDQVVAELAARDVDAVAVDLPGHGASAAPPGDLHGDADHVRSVLDSIDGEVVLVGHSYGGAVVTDAGTHPSVVHLIFLCALVPDEGEPIYTLSLGEDSEMAEAVVVAEDGLSTTIAPDRAAAIFYGGCDDDVVARAIAQLGPQPMATAMQAVRAVAWRSRTSTYVVCGEDRVLRPPAQRAFAERIPNVSVVEWEGASHSPFLANPSVVADLLGSLAG